MTKKTNKDDFNKDMEAEFIAGRTERNKSDFVREQRKRAKEPAKEKGNEKNFAAKKALEIGDRMKDGTIVIAVDLEKNRALFAPKGIFGGNSDFDHQDGVVKKANEQSLAGHKDWRRITDEEASTLARAWEKVAPAALQYSLAPRFWGASSMGQYINQARVYRAYWGNWEYYERYVSRPVPVIRSGPARS